MAARRRAASFSPKTSSRLRINKVEMLSDMACLLLASKALAVGPVSGLILIPLLLTCPLFESMPLPLREIAAQALDVGGIPGDVKPLEHHRQVFALGT